MFISFMASILMACTATDVIVLRLVAGSEIFLEFWQQTLPAKVFSSQPKSFKSKLTIAYITAYTCYLQMAPHY